MKSKDLGTNAVFPFTGWKTEVSIITGQIKTEGNGGVYFIQLNYYFPLSASSPILAPQLSCDMWYRIYKLPKITQKA